MCFGNVCLWADRSKAWGKMQNPIPVPLSNNFQLYGNPEYSEWVENASKDYLYVLSKNWYGWIVHSVTLGWDLEPTEDSLIGGPDGIESGCARVTWKHSLCESEGETTWCKEKNHTDIFLRWRAPGDILFSFFSFFSLSPAPSCDRPVIETPGGPAVFLLLCDTIANPDLASVASLEQHRDVEWLT